MRVSINEWVPGHIENYALVSDSRTATLVGRDGGIDWLCLPRFDSPACFAALLDDEQAGTWRLAPADGGSATRRRYRGDTLVLETEWDTPDGAVRLVDCMPPHRDNTRVVRVVEGLSGRVPMEMLLRPRIDYGHVKPWVRCQDRSASALAGPDALWLDSEVPLSETDSAVHAAFSVSAGQRVAFVLTHTPSHHHRPAPVDASALIAATEAFWSDWMSRCEYHGPWAAQVRRALITVKALTYAPTGGVVVTATTSLPQQLGGARNFDHRRCSLRDATATLHALLGSGYVDEARAWRDWLVRAVAGDPARLRAGYGPDGGRRLPAQTLPWLAGYEKSTPVHVGHVTTDQSHLNALGEVLEGLHVTRVAGLSAGDWGLQRALLDHLEGTWHQPDNGLWEVQGHRQHFVHSKVMAWAGVDRAIRAVEQHGLAGPVDRWRALRAQIRAEVCMKGYDPDRNTFTQYYGSYGVDAALLLLPRLGFLPWQDTRMRGTVAAVRRELCEQDLMLRYRTDGGVDGHPGTEGAHLAASFWLADALHGTGQHREARALFERLLALRNDVGLLSEQYDPTAGRQLGNTPNTASMIALINTAQLLTTGSATPTSALPGQDSAPHSR